MNISACLAKVKDTRKARGKQYSIESILKLVIAGLLGNRNNLKAIHRFGKSLSKAEQIRLGFYKGKIPCYSSLTIILRTIVMETLKAAKRALNDSLMESGQECRLLHIDGKTLRNSDTYGDNAKKQLLTAFSSELRSVCEFIEIIGNDEYNAMLELLLNGNIGGKIITADAAFCHEKVCQVTVKKNADFAFSVKRNEANLYYYANKAFEEAAQNNREIRTFQDNWDLVHGRLERRKIEVIDMPFEYLNGFSYIKQVCKITRERERKNKKNSYTQEAALMITSLDKSYGPEFLLALNRKHWSCENNLHGVKDVIFGEDRSTISTDNSPIFMSLFRDMTIAILNSISDKITETREMFNNCKRKLMRLFTIELQDF